MDERSIRCGECGRMNRLPEGLFVNARCGRCEWPLTVWTWTLMIVRNRSVQVTAQAVAATMLLVVLFGNDVAAWWESKPFRLHEGATVVGQADQGPSLADDLGEASQIR